MSKHSAEDVGGDAVLLGHGHGELRAGPAIFRHRAGELGREVGGVRYVLAVFREAQHL